MTARATPVRFNITILPVPVAHYQPFKRLRQVNTPPIRRRSYLSNPSRITVFFRKPNVPYLISSPTLCFSGAMTCRAGANMEVHVVTIVDFECPPHPGDNDAKTIDNDCSCSRPLGPAVRVFVEQSWPYDGGRRCLPKAERRDQKTVWMPCCC